MHGGKSKRGWEAPATRHGKYSKYLKADSLRAVYDEVSADPDRLNMEHDIALMETLMVDAVQRIGDGAAASSSTLNAIERAYNDLDAHQRAGRKRDAAVAFVRLGQQIDKALGERTARDEVIRLSDHRRKLIESTLKLVIAKRQIMTAEESNVLVQALTDAVFEEVPDTETRSRIAMRFAALLNAPREEPDTDAIEADFEER